MISGNMSLDGNSGNLINLKKQECLVATRGQPNTLVSTAAISR